MTDLVPFKFSEEKSYDEQMRDALEKALAIQGTVINDLESAINCILQAERGLRMLGGVNPSQATADYLKRKYRMEVGGATAERSAYESRKLLEAGKLELAEGEIVDDS